MFRNQFRSYSMEEHPSVQTVRRYASIVRTPWFGVCLGCLGTNGCWLLVFQWDIVSRWLMEHPAELDVGAGICMAGATLGFIVIHQVWKEVFGDHPYRSYQLVWYALVQQMERWNYKRCRRWTAWSAFYLRTRKHVPLRARLALYAYSSWGMEPLLMDGVALARSLGISVEDLVSRMPPEKLKTETSN
ncbi:hypothetical protein Aaci_3122 (plasmid) [Alicyclobacillus acidocaldarius subsp. acidocaldarius DSM 446]|uniref:Uncharacterized protein n=1 Tax=Alicyclobacillus acidocaldarius subsp. acidocaldarius (strain ATCC 27009 / DSM 446 / BCRC 14685 / JCM 5260 / KCTC 1825 / NBRC 15652 / NCIMB 11725 / NRRL B-14509 / 104-IA) TaxID=521098 RepID=C8WYM4_ALIAD|nr:hypothetical protein Aaci_3122 [Alicyclobacillus acidocaldarius subsp. acidocaldarius DSM 446]